MQYQQVSGLLLYCRPGFEGECAAEVQQIATQQQVNGFARAVPASAFVIFECFADEDTERLFRQIDFRQLIFARQLIRVYGKFAQLSPDDRIAPLTELVRALPATREVRLEMPDTNEGKALSTFCRKFKVPLRQHLERQRLLNANSDRVLHLFFSDGQSGWIGVSDPANSSPHACGILRLKLPKDAPSRSTLKLEEAILVLLAEQEQRRLLKPRMLAVDLGACPGGWTYQLVRRGLTVAAVDNGPMQDQLMASGLVEHCREDGFKFQPSRPVDWLVCDMVEQPRRVVDLIGRWLIKGWCRYAMFNLKLPMKKRFQEVDACLQRLRVMLSQEAAAGAPEYSLRAKQLYHDREEITVFVGQVNTAD